MNEKENLINEEIQKKLVEYIDIINIQFREPATTIFASLPLLINNINSNNTEKAIEGLQNIYKNTYSILKGINNAAILAKIMDNHRFDRSMLDFSTLVESVFNNAKLILPDYFELDLKIEDTCFVEGSSTFLTAGLLNLLSNSFDYRQEDNVKVSVCVKKENGRCVLLYRDNSLGIKSHIAQDIFNPFFTCDPYADGEYSKRMGVGLYIAQQAVINAGGTIMLQTEFSEGVGYIISIPDKTAMRGNVLRCNSAEFLLDRYSQVYVQLCEHCKLPDLP